MHPIRNNIYTLSDMLKVLVLRDSPCLEFFYKGRTGWIQTAHVTDEELLSVPGMAESRWRYSHETHEWIPVFEFADSDITTICELVEYEDNGTFYWWATPIGFPRDQEIRFF